MREPDAEATKPKRKNREETWAEEERLVIAEDPKAALDKLLKPSKKP